MNEKHGESCACTSCDTSVWRMPGYFSSHPIAKILVALIIFWFGFEIGELKGAIQERYLGPDRQGDGQMHSGGWRSAGMLPVKIMNSAGAAGSQINTQN